MSDAIKISRLTAGYKLPDSTTKKILDEVSVNFQQGRLSLIIGKNGSGKSTLLNCIAGLIPFDNGNIEIHDSQINCNVEANEKKNIPIEDRNKIGIIFQQKALWTYLNVLENLTHPLMNVHGMKKNEAKEKAYEYLDKFGLKKTNYTQYPLQLSGGEQRKVAIARTFATNPQLLLIDELEANLDQAALEIVLDYIENEFINKGRTVLLITHRIDLLERFAPRIVFLSGSDKKVEEANDLDELLKNQDPSSENYKILKQIIDPARSQWFFGHQCLETAKEISQLNLNATDEENLFWELGEKVSELITKLEPNSEHLTLVTSKAVVLSDQTSPGAKKEFQLRVRSAGKTGGFEFNGTESIKLDDILEQRGYSKKNNKILYDLKHNYKELIKLTSCILKGDKQKQNISLIEMTYNTNAKGLDYQYSDYHKKIEGAFGKSTQGSSADYYQFYGETKFVYLIAIRIGDEVKGVISIDTTSEKKWTNFVMEQFVLIANMAAITLKQFEKNKPKS